DVPELVVGEAEPLRLVAAEVGVDGVGDADEVVEDRPRIRVPEVERDGLLIAVERLEEERVLALLERGHVAAHVAARRRVLDLDPLRAEVGGLRRAPRAGPELFDGQDPNVVERQPQATTCSLCAAPSIIAVSISGFGTVGAGHAFFECERPSPSTSSASLYVSGPGWITGTGSSSWRYGTASCIVVEPMQST